MTRRNARQAIREDPGLESLGGCLVALVDSLPALYRDAVRLADLEDLPLKDCEGGDSSRTVVVARTLTLAGPRY